MDNDGTVNDSDLAMHIGIWGGSGGHADLNRDGELDGELDGGDRAALLNAWAG